MRKPDFIIIGAQKSGTTWLVNRLNGHPAIFMPTREIHYFDVDRNFNKGPDWYYEHFSRAQDDQICGEKTPDYLWVNRPEGQGPGDIAKRMQNCVPDTKLIAILRNPVERAISAYNHFVRGGSISPLTDPDTYFLAKDGGLDTQSKLLLGGLYHEQLAVYSNLFSQNALKVVFFEDDIENRPDDTITDILKFLGQDTQVTIDLPKRPENKRMNSRFSLWLNYRLPAFHHFTSALDRLLPVSPQIRPSHSVIDAMYAHFKPFNEQLFELLGRRTEAWAPD